MVLGCINRIALDTRQIASHSDLGLPCGLYQLMSHTKGKALLFEFEWVLQPTFSSTPSHPL